MSHARRAEKPVPAPVAARRRATRALHGATLVDDYAWLRNANWRAAMHDPAQLDAAIRDYLEAENAYTDARMADAQDLRAALVAEMRARIVEDEASVGEPDGDWLYYSRFRRGGQHPIVCRAPRAAPDRGEQILIDGDAEAKAAAGDFFCLGGVAHSRDHRCVAFGIDARGSEAFTIRVRAIASGEEIQPLIENTTGGVEWSADSQTLFFTTLDAEHRPNKVWRLALGADPGRAECIYAETDPGFFVALGTTQSSDYIVINAHDHETSEAWIVPAATPQAAPRCVAERRVGVEYELDHDAENQDFVILTNADGAEDFKLVRAPVADPGRANWHELVAHAPGRLLLDHVEFADYRVRLERVDALPRLVYTDKRGASEHAIGFAAEAFALGVAPGLEYRTARLRFVYSAPDAPAETYDYDMASGQRALRKRREIPSGFDPAAYVVRRITAAAGDGAEVPITLLYHVDTPIDGSAACVLAGYGAYGLSEAAGFSGNRLSLVDRGVVFAIAHVRGGRERGQAWYDAGKLAHKPNTFSDFIACAEHLIDAGYARRGRIAPFGGSAGGLLVGAVLNQRPELFGAAVADVPFVDVLNTMLDETLPLTPPEWPEWGNPRDDADAFATIRGYCPYQNVTAQDYPPLIVVAGVTDPRVTYWEPAKWVAKLRATKTDANPLLLKTHMGAGHGGVPGRFAALDEIALLYTFVLIELQVVNTADVALAQGTRSDQ